MQEYRNPCKFASGKIEPVVHNVFVPKPSPELLKEHYAVFHKPKNDQRVDYDQPMGFIKGGVIKHKTMAQEVITAESDRYPN